MQIDFKIQVEEYWKRIKLLKKENNNKFFNYDDMEIKEFRGFLIGSKKAFEGEIENLIPHHKQSVEDERDEEAIGFYKRISELKELIKYADENLCEILGK